MQNTMKSLTLSDLRLSRCRWASSSHPNPKITRWRWQGKGRTHSAHPEQDRQRPDTRQDFPHKLEGRGTSADNTTKSTRQLGLEFIAGGHRDSERRGTGCGLCAQNPTEGGSRERAGYGLPDGGGPGLTAEELRRARPRASSPPATLPILQDDDSRDARLFHEDGVRAQLGTAHPLGWGRRTLEGRRSSSGWKGWLPRSSPHRGLPRLFRRLAVPA